MGAIQSSINSLIGSSAVATSVVKGVKMTQEMAAKKAIESATREIEYQNKIQQGKNMKLSAKLLRLKIKEAKGGSK